MKPYSPLAIVVEYLEGGNLSGLLLSKANFDLHMVILNKRCPKMKYKHQEDMPDHCCNG